MKVKALWTKNFHEIEEGEKLGVEVPEIEEWDDLLINPKFIEAANWTTEGNIRIRTTSGMDWVIEGTKENWDQLEKLFER